MKKFTKLVKNNPLLMMMYNSLINLPIPININYWWNYGSLLGMCLMIQIISGLLLSMHYCPNTNMAFNSIIHIMNNVNMGWLIRMIHMNGASFYFMTIYLHIGRNIYFHSFNKKIVWSIGVSIMLISMATAFLGYVLPWGQMSYWGATVITNLLSAIPMIGDQLVMWIWGGFSINNATLNRFYTLHFIMPLLILLMVMLHLFFLHDKGSNNPLGTNSNYYKSSFNPYFSIKDTITWSLMLFLLIMLISQSPYYLSDPDNFMLANPMSTPMHIKPEWYFLFAYTILRSIPNKLGGVIGLMMAIMILYIMPALNFNFMKTSMFYPINKFMFWKLVMSFMMLTWLGMQPIEYPYYNMSMIFTITYFSYYMLTPILNYIWDKLIY